MVNIQGEAHCQIFTVECKVKSADKIDRTFVAKGSSRRKAEQVAAEQILKELDIKWPNNSTKPIAALLLS